MGVWVCEWTTLYECSTYTVDSKQVAGLNAMLADSEDHAAAAVSTTGRFTLLSYIVSPSAASTCHVLSE